MSNTLPESFIAALKEQIKEQYTVILRYRTLKNDADSSELRKKHAAEISLRQENIAEIQNDFLNQAQVTTNLPASDIEQMMHGVVEEFKKELESQLVPLKKSSEKAVSKAVIFTAYANPHGDLASLAREQHGIQDVLMPLEQSGAIKKHITRTDANLDAYFKFLASWQNQLAIFHYGGHANSEELGLHDKATFFDPLAKELVQRNPNSLQLVFLNGCSTKNHVQTLFDLGVKAVIATTVAINDTLASEFAINFYKNLANGDAIETAFKSTHNFIKAKRNSKESNYRMEEEAIFWRGSKKNRDKKHGNDAPLPWGLYINDESVLTYTVFGT